MRLDKYLCDLKLGSRSQVKTFISGGLVSVNGKIIKNCGEKIDENKDLIICCNKTCTYQKYHYLMLNKPKGYVSATDDLKDKTVIDLLKDVNCKDLFPIGRLDKDTTGLLLISNDGALAHSLLHPKKHVNKTYLVEISHSLSDLDIEKLTTGLDIGEKNLTLPAKVEIIDETHIALTIHEGKFHQIKRMLTAVDNSVINLKRISFGKLKLDENLKEGEYRYLTTKEVEVLKAEVL